MIGMAIGALLIFFLAASLSGFATAVRPGKLRSNLTPRELGLLYETVSLVTEDNITLKGWFIPRQARRNLLPASPKALILLHGYPADKGDILPALAPLADEYNLFFFDFRSFGESGGRYTTVGAREGMDVAAGMQFLEARGIREVGLWGFSMGGAVALMAAPGLPAVKAVVADSSYARLSLMAPELYRLPLVKYPLGLLTEFWARVFLGVNVRAVSPADRARLLEIPVLIIHGTDDATIPFTHAARIREALAGNPRAEFWFSENLAHGQLRPDYLPRVRDFFRKNL